MLRQIFVGLTSVMVLFAASGRAPAQCDATLRKLSTDPFANSTSQHRTEVEPDTFAFGSTIVAAFQVGRFFDGGASDIGWATSTDGGSTWSNGFLPGITKFQGAGPYDRVSDPSVAYDARRNVWLISSLALLEAGGIHASAVVVSPSGDGGLTWANPAIVATGRDLDKNWTVCDATATSPFYGNCYTEYDDVSAGDRLHMATSRDGGLTWTEATVPSLSAIGGQPIAQPNGTVIVPMDSPTSVVVVTSTNGGLSYGGPSRSQPSRIIRSRATFDPPRCPPPKSTARGKCTWCGTTAASAAAAHPMISS